jgi:hypothetical protein
LKVGAQAGTQAAPAVGALSGTQSTILGFLERIPAPFEAITAPYRREVAAAVAGAADAGRWRQRGAAMDRHQVVAYALTSLQGD